MSCKKPSPIDELSRRAVCPVCGETSYSRAGIHPQCAQKQADLVRLKRRTTKAKQAEASPNPWLQASDVKAWHKPCPKCKKQVHVRKVVCTCGYSFKR